MQSYAVVAASVLMLAFTIDEAQCQNASFDFTVPVPAGGEDVTRPAKKKRGVVRAGRFFLFVMIVAAIVVVVYQAHKRSETVQGWFATAAAWECTNSVENSAVVKWVKEKYAAFIEAKYCSFWEHPEGEHSAAKTTVTIDGNALLGGAEVPPAAAHNVAEPQQAGQQAAGQQAVAVPSPDSLLVDKAARPDSLLVDVRQSMFNAAPQQPQQQSAQLSPIVDPPAPASRPLSVYTGFTEVRGEAAGGGGGGVGGGAPDDLASPIARQPTDWEIPENAKGVQEHIPIPSPAQAQVQSPYGAGDASRARAGTVYSGFGEADAAPAPTLAPLDADPAAAILQQKLNSGAITAEEHAAMQAVNMHAANEEAGIRGITTVADL